MFNRIRFLIIILIMSFPLSAQIWETQSKIVAQQRNQNTNFGFSVDISGNYAIAGARWESFDENEMDREASAGAAFIYKLENGSWIQKQKLVASDRGFCDYFGENVAIFGDYAVIGSPNDNLRDDGQLSSQAAGAAYVFKREGESWIEQQKLVSSDLESLDYFGSCVDIYDDYIIIGAPGNNTDDAGNNYLLDAGAAYIFYKNNDGTWIQVDKITAFERESEIFYGHRVAIYDCFAIVGSPREEKDILGGNKLNDAGAAYVYYREKYEWQKHQKLTASDRKVGALFGRGVAISENYLIIGAEYEDLDHNGIDSMYKSGAAYIFEKSGTTWYEAQKIVPIDRHEIDCFGWSADINNDYAIVGAYVKNKQLPDGSEMNFSGAAYIFKRHNNIWLEHQKLVANEEYRNDRYGISVALNNNHSIVGSMYDDEDANEENYLANAGAAYIYELNKKERAEIPNEFEIEVLYPNPSNSVINIQYELNISSSLDIYIYNMMGQMINHYKTEIKPAGIYTFIWNGQDRYGEIVTSGTYICKMFNRSSVFNSKMSIVK